MNVRRIAWLGIATDRYEETARFFRDVLGLQVEFEERDSIELSLAETGRVQLFAPGNRYHAFFRQHAKGPVPLLEVDDVRVARSAIEDAGVQMLGSIESDSTWEWIHLRAPDGNLYELGSKRV